MLKGFLGNSEECLNNILYFAAYCRYRTTNSENDIGNTLCVNFGDIGAALEKGEELYDKYWHDCYPWTGISSDLFWTFSHKHRSDFDKATLLAFLAIKSLIGGKPYYKVTNQNVIFKRMAGYKETENYKIPDVLQRFCTRSRFDAIKMELRENYSVVFYSQHVRGMFVSTELPLEKLAYIAEERKLSARRDAARQAEAEAGRKARDMLQTGTA